MKKQIITLVTLLLLLSTLLARAQSDPPPVPPFSPIPIQGLAKIAGTDTIHTGYQTGFGFFDIAGRSWVKKNYISYTGAGKPVYIGPHALSADTLISMQNYVGDSTRKLTITAPGSSVTIASGSGSPKVTEIDSNAINKTARLHGLYFVNRGLAGRGLQYITLTDSSLYNVRYSYPHYKSGSYIWIECQINDVIRDSTTHTPALYAVQLDSVLHALTVTLGYPGSHILVYNPAYYNPPVQGLYPNYPFVESRHDTYTAIMAAKASAYGTFYYDGYYAFKAAWIVNPGMLGDDIIHPEPVGYTFIASKLDSVATAMGISALPFIPQKSQVIGSQYVYGDQTTTGNINGYNDISARNNVASTNYVQPGKLASIDSTGVVVYRDPTTHNLGTRNVQSQDLTKIWGATTVGTDLDFNDLPNTLPGLSPYRLTGNTAANSPFNNGASYHILNFEYGTAKNGTGTITQFAIPTASTTGLNTGMSYRMRVSGTWAGWKHFVQTSGALPTNGQIPIGGTSDLDYTNGNITGAANQITVTNGAHTIALSIPSNLILPSATTATTQATSDSTTKVATTAFVKVLEHVTFPARSFKANNTDSTATPTVFTFKSVAEQAYTGTITWTGTTPPSGTTTANYTWSQIGNRVTLRMNVIYATQGTGLTMAQLTLPADCPAPYKPTGFNSASATLYAGSGGIGTTITSVPSTSSVVTLKNNSANTGFVVECDSSSLNAGLLVVSITYSTN